MTQKEFEINTIEARIKAIDSLEAGLDKWAYLYKDEKKKIDKVIKALEEYEDLLYEILEDIN